MHHRFTRSAFWVSATSFLLLAMPVVFEQERFNLEQQQQQHQRQVLFLFLTLLSVLLTVNPSVVLLQVYVP